MAQSLIDVEEIKEELVVFLRNSDILTIAERGATTTTATGTFAGETELLINRTNVKNIRSVVVASVTLDFGEDYTVEYNYNDSGTYKCKISFAAAQTGAYTITYDYGSDKIYPDYPRDDLTISSYPRIAVDILNSNTDAFGIGGNEYITDITISVTIFAHDTKKISELITNIRKEILESNKSFYYLRFIKPIGIGPLIEDPTAKQEIMRQNTDFLSMFNVETIT